MHHAGIAEPHLVLLRVYVHVHTARRHFQEENKGWMSPVKQHILKCLPYRVGDDLVLHDSSIDKEVLSIGPGPVITWFCHPAVQTQFTALLVDQQRVIQEITAAKFCNAIGLLPKLDSGAQLSNRPAVV